MTQTYTTVPVNHLASITFYGSRAEKSIDVLRDLLPNHHTKIADYVRRSDELIAANQRREEKRRETSIARNALIYVRSRINLDSVDQLRAAAENPTRGHNLDALYTLVKSMANPDDVPAVDRFFTTALISGHANTACHEAERRAGEVRFALSQDLGIA